MQIWLYARTRKSHPGYEESTHEEFQVCGQYRNNAFEMHNKVVSWHRMVSKNVLVSGCDKSALQGKTKNRYGIKKERGSAMGCSVREESEDGPAESE
jgi:hypothetical protein